MKEGNKMKSERIEPPPLQDLRCPAHPYNPEKGRLSIAAYPSGVCIECQCGKQGPIGVNEEEARSLWDAMFCDELVSKWGRLELTFWDDGTVDIDVAKATRGNWLTRVCGGGGGAARKNGGGDK